MEIESGMIKKMKLRLRFENMVNWYVYDQVLIPVFNQVSRVKEVCRRPDIDDPNPPEEINQW
jgi:hypothetical protein